jgi:microcystin-dependent protein
VTLNVNQIPAHSHAPVCSTQAGNAGEAAGLVWAGSSTNETLYQTGSNPNGSMATGLIASSGNSQPHSNLQPFLVGNFIIALQGIFPSRN